MNSEPLSNLHRIGLLDSVPFSHELQQKMLHVAQSRLDSLRKQRNLTDYDGELITESLLKECLDQAQALLAQARQSFIPS